MAAAAQVCCGASDQFVECGIGQKGAVIEARRTIDFLNIPVDVLDTHGLFERIVALARSGKPNKVTYLNAHCTVLACRDAGYRDFLNRADLVYADGQSVVWAARLLGDNLPCRSTGADFLADFCRGFAGQGLRVYLFGAAPGRAEKAAGKLREAAPGLEIVGVRNGYFEPHENEALVADIVEARPDILIVGMGVPLQEEWIDRNLDRLNVPVVWGVGALFDFVAGDLARGPKFLVDNGFEWLCRLCVEPKRLWKRFLIGNLKFIFYVLAYKFSRKKAGGKADGASRESE
jgi:N-acetylglucosaminyldiphosphoundecaprenol N-acetyl-beta-D-mannosaminyltransferase